MRKDLERRLYDLSAERPNNAVTPLLLEYYTLTLKFNVADVDAVERLEFNYLNR